jgi:hypothetical protein
MYGSVMMKAFGNGKSIKQSDNDNAYTGGKNTMTLFQQFHSATKTMMFHF